MNEAVPTVDSDFNPVRREAFRMPSRRTFLPMVGYLERRIWRSRAGMSFLMYIFFVKRVHKRGIKLAFIQRFAYICRTERKTYVEASPV